MWSLTCRTVPERLSAGHDLHKACFHFRTARRFSFISAETFSHAHSRGRFQLNCDVIKMLRHPCRFAIEAAGAHRASRVDPPGRFLPSLPSPAASNPGSANCISCHPEIVDSTQNFHLHIYYFYRLCLEMSSVQQKLKLIIQHVTLGVIIQFGIYFVCKWTLTSTENNLQRTVPRRQSSLLLSFITAVNCHVFA